MTKHKKTLSYEEAINELECILRMIEEEDLPIDDLTKHVERASFLLKMCKEKIFKTEQEVKEIMEQLDS